MTEDKPDGQREFTHSVVPGKGGMKFNVFDKPDGQRELVPSVVPGKGGMKFNDESRG